MYKVVKNGTVVTASGISRGDIGIDGEVISQIGGSIPDASQVIDATDCYVFPGGVDVHTHLDAPGFSTHTADDFQSGSIAAVCGGTTSIVDFCQQTKGKSLREGLLEWHRKAEGKAVVDYGFHMMITDMNESVLSELSSLPDQGITSFKLFMAYKGTVMLDDLALLNVLQQAAGTGALVMVHAENGDAVHYLQRRLLSEAKIGPEYHSKSRPPRVEAEATARAIALAETIRTPIYIVHLTCQEALDEVVRGRQRGATVLAETCTHYLYATEHDLARPNFEGAKYVFSPPPRRHEDHAVLWNALANGTLQAVSSDHASWCFKGVKELGREDFTKIPNGAPGIEERMIAVYEGVNRAYISLTRFVDLVATTPAKIFGLFPRKGTIAVGSDADLVIWNPQTRITIEQRLMHHACDYTLYEGRSFQGAPRDVIRRGELIVRNREFIGQSGTGRFLKRQTSSHCYH